MKPTLTVLCPTAHPGPLVYSALCDLKPLADETIVAADEKVGGEDLGFYSEVATRLVRFPFVGANRHWPWLLHQAKGEWVLIMDGDEVPSQEFLDALPQLMSDPDCDSYTFPIHWPYKGSKQRLADEPWYSDHRLRLVRRSGRVWMEGKKHELFRTIRPSSNLFEFPVYHLDLLTADYDARVLKSARYDLEKPGKMTAEGYPFNQALYLPEDREALTLEAIPEVDSARIDRSLSSGDPSPDPVDPEGVELVTEEEVMRFWPGRELDEGAYKAKIEVGRRQPRTWTAGGAEHVLWVKVTNTGDARWPGGGDDSPPLIRLGMTWRVVGQALSAGRGTLTRPLEPGQSMEMPLVLSAPDITGPAILEVDLVHEHVRWFGDPLSLSVELEPSLSDQLQEVSQGGLASLEDVLAVRRRAGRDQALVIDRQAEIHGSPAPSDPQVRIMLDGLTLGEWALDGPSIDLISSMIETEKPEAAVEFGSGTSTVLLAWLMRQVHDDQQLRVVSFEQDEQWVLKTRQMLEARGLQNIAAVFHAPLREGDRGGTAPCYDIPREGLSAVEMLQPELCLVDGPSWERGASRQLVLDRVRQYLAPGAHLLLDDALRDAELSIALAWEADPLIAVQGIWLTPKGLLQARLR